MRGAGFCWSPPSAPPSSPLLLRAATPQPEPKCLPPQQARAALRALPGLQGTRQKHQPNDSTCPTDGGRSAPGLRARLAPPSAQPCRWRGRPRATVHRAEPGTRVAGRRRSRTLSGGRRRTLPGEGGGPRAQGLGPGLQEHSSRGGKPGCRPEEPPCAASRTKLRPAPAAGQESPDQAPESTSLRARPRGRGQGERGSAARPRRTDSNGESPAHSPVCPLAADPLTLSFSRQDV